MVFSSSLFLFLFLPMTLLGYFAVTAKLRNVFLLLASLFFYAWGETFLVLLLFASLVVNYGLALLLEAFNHKHEGESRPLYAKLILLLTIVFNLAPLFYFKYSNFIVSNLSNIFGSNLNFIQN